MACAGMRAAAHDFTLGSYGIAYEDKPILAQKR